MPADFFELQVGGLGTGRCSSNRMEDLAEVGTSMGILTNFMGCHGCTAGKVFHLLLFAIFQSEGQTRHRRLSVVILAVIADPIRVLTVAHAALESIMPEKGTLGLVGLFDRLTLDAGLARQ